MKKRRWFALMGTGMTALACTFAAWIPTPPPPVDEVGTVVAATIQALTAAPGANSPTQAGDQVSGNAVSFQNMSFTIPDGLANGSTTETMTALTSNSGAPWEIGPTHLRFTLTGYQLQGKLHEPRLYVYPAEEYAQSNSSAVQQIDRLRKILAGSALLQETLPAVPFFNATPQLAAQIKLVPFENGSGVRTLTQYAQYAAPVNNHELFYHFQGLTQDGKFYVIAILPITAPILPEDERVEATVPQGGIPIPTAVGPNEIYYFSVTETLNSLPQDEFTPSLNMLDALIQSILVTTP